MSPRHFRPTRIGMNMTPMIDVTFLLLTFFMLASHFASAERVKVELPRPHDNQAIEKRLQEKVIINLLYENEHAPPAIRLGPFTLHSNDELAHRLQEIARDNPQIQVILRADRRLPYREVRRVMERVARVGLSRLQVVTELNPA